MHSRLSHSGLFRTFRLFWAAPLLLGMLALAQRPAFADEPPVLTDFGLEYLGDELWVLYGSLDDEQADFCTVYFGGVLDGYFVDVGTDGEFALVIDLPPGNFGAVSASAVDDASQWSNTMWEYLPNY